MPSPNRSPDSETYLDWTNLPIELLAGIAKRLTSIHDYISFRGVCSYWRSAATFENFDREFPRVPWLMYVSGEGRKGIFDCDVAGDANFLDLSKNKTYKMINFPPVTGRRYLSCGGWILYVADIDVKLTHPLWRIKIELPGLDTLPEYKHELGSSTFVGKMVLSDSPAKKTDLVVMVIWGTKSQLGFSRPGDSSWTVMDSWDDPFCDIIYHNRRLYAVDVSQRVVECDIHGPNPAQILQVFSSPNSEESFDHDFSSPIEDICYLVESLGKFLIVSRHFESIRTVSFQIFEFDLRDSSYKEIYDLGKRALFLGFNSSFCLELSATARKNKVKPNRIYFTDHFGRYWMDEQIDEETTGVYCLSDRSTRSIRDIFSGFLSASIAPSVFIVPSF